MESTNLNIMQVRAYFEKSKISNKALPFKTAVLKVRYDNGSWDTVFRTILTHVSLSAVEKSFIEQYKSLDLNQIRQISFMLNEKEQKVFGLYLKKYFKYDLNINSFIAKRSKKQYAFNKISDILSKTKSAFQQFNLSLKRYNVNSENITNI